MDYKFETLYEKVNGKEITTVRRLLSEFRSDTVSKQTCLDLLKILVDIPVAKSVVADMIDTLKLPDKKEELLEYIANTDSKLTPDICERIYVNDFYDVESTKEAINDVLINSLISLSERTQLELKFAVSLINDLKKENAELKSK